MSEPHNSVEQVALDWLVRVNDPLFDDWTGWEAWLARDPRHAEAYWRLAEAEAEITAALADEAARRPTPASRRPAPKRRTPWYAVAAAAAAAVVALGLWTAWPRPTWSVETAPGEQRSLTLADGTRLHLDGDTRVTLDRRNSRRATLDEGRLLAEVVHDDARPFVVLAGEAVLTDLGTAFEATRLEDGVRVAVSEGLVRVDGIGAPVTLSPGQGLISRGGRVTRRSVSPEAVDAWRARRLVYRDEPLAVVAQDLSRALGRPVEAAPEVAEQRFTGSLNAATPPEALRPRLETLLDVSIEDDGRAWRLSRRRTR